MFYTNFNDVMKAIESIDNGKLVVCDNAYPLDSILIQPLDRTIAGKTITFNALRNIEVAENARGNGVLKSVIESLEKSQIPVMVDDVVNKNVEKYLTYRGYSRFEYYKNGHSILAMYKFKETNE